MPGKTLFLDSDDCALAFSAAVNASVSSIFMMDLVPHYWKGNLALRADRAYKPP